jgi:molecular chaperone HtpG
MANTTIESFEFKTEVNQLLDLVIHSLYSHKDIFLRELISNASDALDKLRFESLKDQALLGDDHDLKITLVRDDKNKTLTIIDNGIGMSHEELIANLGTIAKSGTKEFIEKVKQAKGNLDLIGQFGVGFYSSFMVADTVSVVSKPANGPAHVWTSEGKGKFALEPATKTTRGTEVTLHLKKDCEDYLDEYRLRDIVKKYSDFVDYAVQMDVEREEYPKDKDGNPDYKAKATKKIETETLNSRKAIWTKSKNEITKEEYTEFYKHVSHDFEEPLEVIHYSAEGTNEFKALLYIPGKAPFDLYMRDSIKGINLYIKRIFIMNDCKKLIPEYLRFMRGVVDSSDLPLNVSREILQEDVQLTKIQKNIVKKILTTLKTLKDKEPEKYLKFYKEFGPVLKEGLHYDQENKDALMDLLLFETMLSGADQKKSLEDYVNGMPKEQKELYYIIAEDRQTALASPHLEVFRSKGFDVLLMTDAVDEWIVQQMFEYKGKKVKPVDKGDVELEDKKESAQKEQKAKEQFGTLLDYLKEHLKEKVKDVKFSQRLTDSPCCLVADENDMSEQMARMYKSMGQPVPESKKILEINPNHPLIASLQKILVQDKQSPILADYSAVLYDQAMLAAGGKLEDMAGFLKRMNTVLLKAAGSL